MAGETGRPEQIVLTIRERLKAVAHVDLPVRLWDGTAVGDGPFRLVLNHPGALRSVLLPPSDLAAGEAYVHGDVDVEGDLVAALHTIAAGSAAPIGWRTKLEIVRLLLRLPAPPRHERSRRARLRGRRHSIDRDRAAVQFHYDLGNDFFRLFLDEAMVYSCAYFPDGDGSLETAQRRKLDLVCRKLALQPGERFLDVGCGWGSLVLHAAEHYGVEAVGVTLSEQQADLARQRVAVAGLADRVEIRLADYREVTESFDAVASVGMFEHVGAEKLPEYFGHLHRLTADGGRLLNHGITTGRRQVTRDLSEDRRSFVGKYVFPDGALVPAWRAVQEMERAGFEPIDLQQLRPHYARTLRAWVGRLERNHDRAVEVASERDYRIWRAYMAGSAVGFESNDLGVVQVLGSRGARLPLDRGYMQVTASGLPAEAVIDVDDREPHGSGMV